MTIHTIGDSTMHRRWGDMIEDYFDSNLVSVINHAQGGRSSKSFRDEGFWDDVVID